MNNLCITPITITELKDVQQTMINLINSYPEMPSEIKKDGVFLEQLKPKSISMCMSTIPNPIRIKTYLCGSYVAKYPFKLILQTMSVSNDERMDSQAILSKIGEWFEGRTLIDENGNLYNMGEYPKMSDGRKITSIYRTDGARIIERLAPNIEITEAKYAVEYFVKNDF